MEIFVSIIETYSKLKFEVQDSFAGTKSKIKQTLFLESTQHWINIQTCYPIFLIY
jgi:hypothetical protein